MIKWGSHLYRTIAGSAVGAIGSPDSRLIRCWNEIYRLRGRNDKGKLSGSFQTSSGRNRFEGNRFIDDGTVPSELCRVVVIHVAPIVTLVIGSTGTFVVAFVAEVRTGIVDDVDKLSYELLFRC